MSFALLDHIRGYISYNKPELELGIGIAFVTGAIVKAIHATRKNNADLEELEDRIVTIRDGMTDEAFEYPDGRKDLFAAYKDLGVLEMKIYGETIFWTVAGIALMIHADSVHVERETEYGIAIASLSATVNNMYDRAKTKYGKAAADEIRYGIKEETVEVETEDENGNKVKETKTVSRSDDDPRKDLYTVPWLPTSGSFESNPILRDNTLAVTMDYFNNLLQIREKTEGVGYVFFDEVLKYLDISYVDEEEEKLCTEDIMIPKHVGWAKDSPYGDGDIRIEMIDGYKKNEQGAIVPAVYLTFNVDGPIEQYIFRKSKHRRLSA